MGSYHTERDTILVWVSLKSDWEGLGVGSVFWSLSQKAQVRNQEEWYRENRKPL